MIVEPILVEVLLARCLFPLTVRVFIAIKYVGLLFPGAMQAPVLPWCFL